jgi:hypothetical protein
MKDCFGCFCKVYAFDPPNYAVRSKVEVETRTACGAVKFLGSNRWGEMIMESGGVN